MDKHLRILIVEDSEDDALLILRELKKAGYTVEYQRVDNARDMVAALQTKNWHLVLSDYTMPHFSGPDALKTLQNSGQDIPFIIISGKIGEETAIETMLSGADDYIMKSNLKRLIPAVERELREMEVRRERKRAEEQIISLSKFPQEDPSPVLRVDLNGNIMFHNRASLPLLYLWQTEIGKPLPREYIDTVTAAVTSGSPITIDVTCQERVYSLTFTPIQDTGYLNIYGNDITERKKAEDRIKRLHSVLLLIRKINQLIVIVEDEDTLLKEACEALVSGHNYSIAWIGLKQENTFEVRAAAYASRNKASYLPKKVTWDDGPYGQGVTGTAIRTGKPAIILDARHNERTSAWHEDLQTLGYISFASIPLTLEKQVIGALTVGSEQKVVFDEEEMDLLTELAGDISMGLLKIRQRRKIHEEEEKYRTLVESSNDGITILQDELIKFANASLFQATGYTSEDILNKPFQDFVAPSFRSLALERYRRRLAGEVVPNRYEIEVIAKDGHTIPVEINSSFVEFEGRPADMAILRDLTERKESERKLRESEARFRMLAENASDLIYRYVFKPVPGFEYVSPSATRITGYTPEEHYADPQLGFKIVIPEDRHLLEGSIQPAPGETEQAMTLRWRHKDGHIIWTEQRNHYIYNANGELIAIEGIARDITERKQAEEALKRSEENFRRSIENSPVGIRIVTEEGDTLFINKSLLAMWGYDSAEEWLATPRSVLYTPEAYQAHLERVAKRRRGEYVPSSYEISIRRKDGQVRYLLVSRAKIDWDYQPNYQMVYQDITERKKAEEQTRLQAQLLDTAMDAIYLRDFEGNLIYVNNAMTTLTGYSKEELLKRNVRDLITPANILLLAERHRQILEEGQIRFEAEFLHRNGTIIPAEIIAQKITFEGRDMVMIAARDVTRRKEAEDRLKESEERYRSIFNRAPVSIITIDENGTITDVNPYHTDVILRGEQTRESLVGKNLLEELEKVKPEIVETHRRVLQGEEVTMNDIVLPAGTLGPSIYINVKGVPLYRNNEICGAIFISEDISERKRAEAKLRESEANFRNLLENSPLGIRIFTADDETLYVNKALLDIFGCRTIDELKAYPDEEHLTPESLALQQERRKMAQKGERPRSSVELRIRRKSDGEIRLIRSLITDVMWNGEKQLQAIIQDITEEKKAAEALAESYRITRRILEGVTNTIAATIEIRDPYTSGHQRRVAHLSRAIALEMGLSEEKANQIYTAGLIHDIGKISVPAEILSKPGKLNDIEFSLIKIHPRAGYDLLNNIEFPFPVARWVLEHHERMNGSGYPSGLKDDEISIEARILAVADVVEAMSSHRPYRPSLGTGTALEEITEKKGELYDPQVVDACLRLFWEKGYRLE